MCRVFISHSEEDSVFVEHIRRLLFLIDVECLIAERKPEAGKELWDKIQQMIEDSYFIIPILTTSGITSDWVQREITMAKTLKKRFIPVVDRIVKENLPHPLKGKEFIPYEADALIDTLEKIVFQVRDYKKNDIGFATNC